LTVNRSKKIGRQGLGGKTDPGTADERIIMPNFIRFRGRQQFDLSPEESTRFARALDVIDRYGETEEYDARCFERTRDLSPHGERDCPGDLVADHLAALELVRRLDMPLARARRYVARSRGGSLAHIRLRVAECFAAELEGKRNREDRRPVRPAVAPVPAVRFVLAPEVPT
jgi:hypothetical protein